MSAYPPSYDARPPGLGQHASRDPGLQATFHADPPARLELPKASPGLAGTYECRVDYNKAPSTTTLLQVSSSKITHNTFHHHASVTIVVLTHYCATA